MTAVDDFPAHTRIKPLALLSVPRYHSSVFAKIEYYSATHLGHVLTESSSRLPDWWLILGALLLACCASRSLSAVSATDAETSLAEKGSAVSTNSETQPSVADIWLEVSVSAQRLRVFTGNQSLAEYPVSTSRYGVGSAAGSHRTPLGQHRIHAKIGGGAPAGAVFVGRRRTGQVITPENRPLHTPGDTITSRILWLEGTEPGINRGAGIDSRERLIYIHGTDEEGLIGQPASIGCIRMHNRDVIRLFDQVQEGTRVLIQK